ncbi:hypothetical protein F3087_40425 [Nocardia colli]|uniref:Peptidase inhibitor family I36 n=1 Tax=Nocardia colli TaxID=2545717 RepID=A0A5N0DWZ6_9NOCA|nr:hypothetical protein [Nocardia colli]KAA8880589.1 hypothetical protein F3087_40425 [Nocardia colli]
MSIRMNLGTVAALVALGVLLPANEASTQPPGAPLCAVDDVCIYSGPGYTGDTQDIYLKDVTGCIPVPPTRSFAVGFDTVVNGSLREFGCGQYGGQTIPVMKNSAAYNIGFDAVSFTPYPSAG